MMRNYKIDRVSLAGLVENPGDKEGIVTSSADMRHVDPAPPDILNRIAETDRCAALLAIWCAARTDPPNAPAKSDLDPIALARAGLLPFVWLLERDADGTFFYRLVGEGIRRHFSGPIRGKHLHEVYDGECLALVDSRCRQVLDDRSIMFSSGPVYRDGKPVYYARRLLLPVCDDAGEGRYLIGTVDQTDVDEPLGVEGSPRFTSDFVSFLPMDAL